MVHCKHEYEPSIHRGRSHTGGSRKVTSTTHGVLLYSVFLISWTICVICLCVLVPKNILALQVTKKGKKKAMQIQENSIMLLKKKKNGLHLEMLGFEPRTFCMQSRRSTTELHPLPGCQGPHRVVNEDTAIAATHVQISYKITCLSL